MRKLALLATFVVAAATLLVGSSAFAGQNGNGKANKKMRNFSAHLTGYQEVPAISTTGRGGFTARLKNGEIEYTLRYSGLEGTAQQAHIHFGQPRVNGGVIAWLCGDGGKPACPASGMVSGTIDASDIVGPVDQGIATGEFAEALRAMRHRVAYVNVHTDSFASGEIRGQIRPGLGKGKGKGGG